MIWSCARPPAARALSSTRSRRSTRSPSVPTAHSSLTASTDRTAPSGARHGDRRLRTLARPRRERGAGRLRAPTAQSRHRVGGRQRPSLWDAANGRAGWRAGSATAVDVRDIDFDPAGPLDGHRQRRRQRDGLERRAGSSGSPSSRGHDGRRRSGSTAFSPCGAHVLTASADGPRASGTPPPGASSWPCAIRPPLAIARFSPDGARIATGADDGVVRIWDARSGARRAELRGHTGAVLSLAWDRSGARLVSAERRRRGSRLGGRHRQADPRLSAARRAHGLRGRASPPRRASSPPAPTTRPDWSRRAGASSSRSSTATAAGVRASTAAGTLGVSATFNRSAKIWSLGRRRHPRRAARSRGRRRRRRSGVRTTSSS